MVFLSGTVPVTVLIFLSKYYILELPSRNPPAAAGHISNLFHGNFCVGFLIVSYPFSFVFSIIGILSRIYSQPTFIKVQSGGLPPRYVLQYPSFWPRSISPPVQRAERSGVDVIVYSPVYLRHVFPSHGYKHLWYRFDNYFSLLFR